MAQARDSKHRRADQKSFACVEFENHFFNAFALCSRTGLALAFTMDPCLN